MKTKLLVLLFLASLSTYAQTNLVPNGGFENWTNSTTLSNWTIENNVTQNTTTYSEGSKSVQLAIANSTTKPKITALVPMIAGTTYTVKFKYKYVSANYSGDHPISLNISQNGSATTLSSSTFATNNNWTVKETTFTPDQNLSYDLSISLYTFDAAAFNVLIDDVQVYVQGTEQYTLIPDVNFENKLIALGIDSGATDGKVLTSSIASVTTLNVDTTIISDLTGIQDFVNLKTLKCVGNSSSTNGGDGKLSKLDVTKNVLLTSLECTANQIPNLDLSQNTFLTTLNCKGNKLTSLDVSKNVALKELTCGFNQLTNLDVTKNVALTSLGCDYNQLTAIDISKNMALTFLGCDYNQFTNIDISKNVNLINFWCSYNKLTTLDVTENLALMYLYCQSNQLTTLDISNNLALKHLYSFSNQLTTLDVSNNENLIAFFCNSNKLLSLNLKNGKNTSLNNYSVDFTGNPYLSCITVDNVNYSNTNWANKKENTAFFSEYICNTITQIPDDKFEDKLIALGIDTDGKNGLVLNSSIGAITSIDLSNSFITNLKGIQGFTALTTLNCSGNILKKLDLSKNTLFSTLNCANNPSLRCIQVNDINYATANWNTIKDAIASYNLDCTAYTLIPDPIFEDKLIALGIDQDGKNGKVATESIASITSLNVSNSSIDDLTGIQDFVGLTTLQCMSNQLTAIDISKNVALTYLDCSFNSLTALDVSKHAALNKLNFSGNQISVLDLSQNTALSKLDCSYNRIANLDVSKNTNLTFLGCTSNLLKSLDVTLNTSLQYLSCGNNGSNGNTFSVLDISKNINLIELQFPNVYLSSIDLRKNVALKKLDCRVSNLSSLDLSMNTDLESLLCDNNKLLNLDISANKLLKDLVCRNNQLTSLDISNNSALLLLDCYSNKLKTINLKNGNNVNMLLSHGIYFQYFTGNSGLDYYTSFQKNTDLSCILVDNATYANTNWAAKKDSFAFYTPYDCSTVTQIADAKFEEKLISLGIDTDGKNGVVLNSSIAAITTLDVSNSSISDLSGIQGFSALTALNCSGNLLKKVDLSKNTTFSTLNCSNNPNLICIQVADVAYAIANWATTKDVTASFSLDCNIYTLIPDPKFEDKLIALQIDRDGKNGKVVTESIVSITALDVSSSSITDLTGIQDFVALKTLYCQNNQLTALDFSKNVALTNIESSNNQLTNLNISTNTNLVYLDCSSNKLTALDVSKNTVLRNLKCSGNQLTILDLSNNTELTYLLAHYNQLTAFDVSKNAKLFQIWCSYNKIKTLDFSKNPLLTQVLCSNNRLVSLNIKNGKNTAIPTTSGNNGGVRFNDNPDLKCILVDDAVYANANWGTKKDATASYNTDCTLYTLIPDSNFEQKLIDLGIDTDGKNGKVLSSNVFLLTSLNVSGSSISDLTGIEDFVSLTELNCNNNVLTTLNVAKTKDLTSLKCSYNQLTTLDLSKNITLIDLECSNNNLTSLNITLNKVLTELNCSSNKLTSLDVAGNKALIHLDCSSNKLTTLDVSYNTALIGLACSSNQLKTLDVSKNTLLQSLSISQNALEQLNVTNNTKLESILCSNNLLRTLDLSKNVKITTIDCSYNRLKTLNLRNGNNTLGAGMMFVKNFTNNPDLTCIEVDDVTYSDTNWKYYKDATANYNVGCYTLIPDANFEDKLIALGIDTDGKNGKVATASIASLTSLDVNSSSIVDLTGIQDFTGLTYLRLSYNNVSTIDVSKNTALTSLSCYSNKITNLDISQNTALSSLNCGSNLLTSLDVSKNTSLTYIDCSSNKLIDLDVSKNTALTSLNCSYNKLQTLNLKNGKNTLLLNSNIDLKGNQNLYCILVDDVAYSNTNWANRKDTTAKFNTECSGLSLPANNFNIEAKGETCLNANNGEISITATATYAYKATINTSSYTFTNNSLKVANLAPGTYTVSITIPGETFEQSYTIVIPKGATITGKSSVNANKVAVEITEGTAPFTVYVDGVEQFETTDTSFTVETKKGGLVQVKTAKECEGTYTKEIARIDGVVAAYPNPTSGSFEVEIPTTKKEVGIGIYTMNGTLISTKTYTIENGKAQLSLENQPSGVYVVKIELDTPDYLKIIKN